MFSQAARCYNKVNSYFHVKSSINPVSSYTNEVVDFLSTQLAIFLNNKQFLFIKLWPRRKSPLAEKAPGLLPVDVLAPGPFWAGPFSQKRLSILHMFTTNISGNMNRRLKKNKEKYTGRKRNSLREMWRGSILGTLFQKQRIWTPKAYCARCITDQYCSMLRYALALVYGKLYISLFTSLPEYLQVSYGPSSTILL